MKALYARLSGAGLSCWMDIAQMGGGDSLYEKIDRGVRGCRVVLSCVTRKYALSANCRREVSLADALRKPIIPLLLEKSAWPPEGPMSMVFTQLLYINFTAPDESVQRHWKGAQFDELLSKITAQVQPITDAPAATDAASPNKANDTEAVATTNADSATKSNENEPLVTKSAETSQSVPKQPNAATMSQPAPKKSGFCSLL